MNVLPEIKKKYNFRNFLYYKSLSYVDIWIFSRLERCCAIYCIDIAGILYFILDEVCTCAYN